MIQITAQINLIEPKGEIQEVASKDVPLNNVSSLPPINRISKGSNAWIIGYNKIGDNATLDDKVENGGNIDYYISGQGAISDDIYVEGKGYKLNTPIQIEVYGEKLPHIIISFDNTRRIYPIMFIENSNFFSNYIYPKNSIVKINASRDNTIASFFIEYINKPNSPLIIYGLTNSLDININNSNILDIDISHKERADNEKPDFGIISNSGNMSFIDNNNYILDLLQNKMLAPNQDVIFTLEDTLSGKKEVIGKYLTDKFNYDSNNKEVRVDIVDDLTLMQDKQIYLADSEYIKSKKLVNVFTYLPKWSQNQLTFDTVFNAKQLYDILLSYSYEYSFEPLSSNMINYLTTITYQYIWITNTKSLWSWWQDFCDLCGLYMYKNNEGKIAFDYIEVN